MACNIEIKSRIRDFTSAKSLAEALSDVPGVLLRQHDTFYRVPGGRLKLRVVRPGGSELISYRRSDSTAPRLSEYWRSTVEDPASMNRLLTAALGTCGEVRKKRWLYLVGQTRIHLDRVEGLGDFLEMEYVLQEGEQDAAGRQEIEHLVDKLQIQQDDMVAVAYIDLLRKTVSE